MKNMVIGVKFFLAATILTGLIYPLFITLIGQTLFSQSSNGRFDLIAQKFDQDKYFWPRPSSQDYNPLPSGGSNLSPTSKQLKQNASGSGLDPHISPSAALFQVDRVARARGLDSSKKDEIIKLIGKLTEGRDLNVFGEPRVNVLRLNVELDNIH